MTPNSTILIITQIHALSYTHWLPLPIITTPLLHPVVVIIARHIKHSECSILFLSLFIPFSNRDNERSIDEAMSGSGDRIEVLVVVESDEGGDKPASPHHNGGRVSDEECGKPASPHYTHRESDGK